MVGVGCTAEDDDRGLSSAAVKEPGFSVRRRSANGYTAVVEKAMSALNAAWSGHERVRQAGVKRDTPSRRQNTVVWVAAALTAAGDETAAVLLEGGRTAGRDYRVAVSIREVDEPTRA